MTNYYIEIRATVRRTGPPILVPLEDVDNYTGFRSVYAYDRTVAQEIQAQGNTFNLRGKEVYSDCLLMDFDGADPINFREFLKREGIGYEEWHSGGRSVHIHIPIVPVFGDWVPAAQKAWVKEHCTDRADVSFYHPAGQFRLPRTFHFKYPGRCKMLIESHPGRVLEIAKPEPKKRAHAATMLDGATREDFFMLATEHKDEGGRRPHIWKMCVAGIEAGMDEYDVLDHIRWWNTRFCAPPHADAVLIKQLEQAFIYVRRKTTA